jgi:hypothetical protein
VFGAAALEALAEHGALDQVTHLSSVSGGSFTAAYFLANPPACGAIPTPEARQACWHAYFSGFKQQMRVNYWYRMFGRNARPWRFSSPTRRATSLQEILDKRFLHGKTFGELPARPVLMINTTSYDETRRFVFSNACLAEGASDPSTDPSAPTRKRYQIMAAKALAQRALQAYTFSRPQCQRPVPADLPLSLAVVASAAFPPLIGPISIQAPSECDSGAAEWWHLGDGGIIENSGTDSLEEVFLRRLAAQGPPPEKAWVLSVDAGAQPDPETLKQTRKFNMYRGMKASLVVDSPRVRGQAYHDVFWRDLEAELLKEGIGYEKLTFRYSQAELDVLPASCMKKLPDAQSIADHLPTIPTKLRINACDADLLELAAHQLVHATLDDAMARRMRSEGFPIHAAEGCTLSR